ncbi:hypothetical protein, partial [Gemmiger formicilis]|uniref:hypothetical protein n=1 Tax=Gemmiger formicilis TaxID=745368 RepID=UPI003080EB9E
FGFYFGLSFLEDVQQPLFGDPYGNRTSIILQISFNAIRTNDNFITGMDFIKGYFYICVVQSVVLFI